MNGMIRISDVLILTSVDSHNGLEVSTTLWWKRETDEYAEVLESVRRYGVQNPILIREEKLCNGHHRVAACVDLGIVEIPFTDDPTIGWANEFEWPEEKEAQNCE
jgi:hypothetical protein